MLICHFCSSRTATHIVIIDDKTKPNGGLAIPSCFDCTWQEAGTAFELESDD